MTPNPCAEIVRTRDPDRFLATMAAPPAARAKLWPLYALNLELARAAWVSAEPMVCLMRLQWWADVLGAMGPGTAPPAHEVAGPVHALVSGGVPGALLAGMAEARAWDAEAVPFRDEDDLRAYLDRTAGGLMWAAALALGAPAPAEPVVRDFARGAGLAAWFCAAAELTDRGRMPLPDPSAEGTARLAREGLAAIARARRAGRSALPPAVRPALWAGWQAPALLEQAAREPWRVAAGRLGLSEFRRRGGLLWRSLTGGV
ncbi:MAG: squalene/phytoene synthase family protein [Thermoleophilia bacterium]|nr:squalene/phytoene synthase family protein [Thermoleophilia bacterium]